MFGSVQCFFRFFFGFSFFFVAFISFNCLLAFHPGEWFLLFVHSILCFLVHYLILCVCLFFFLLPFRYFVSESKNSDPSIFVIIGIFHCVICSKCVAFYFVLILFSLPINNFLFFPTFCVLCVCLFLSIKDWVFVYSSISCSKFHSDKQKTDRCVRFTRVFSHNIYCLSIFVPNGNAWTLLIGAIIITIASNELQSLCGVCVCVNERG